MSYFVFILIHGSVRRQIPADYLVVLSNIKVAPLLSVHFFVSIEGFGVAVDT